MSDTQSTADQVIQLARDSVLASRTLVGMLTDIFPEGPEDARKALAQADDALDRWIQQHGAKAARAFADALSGRGSGE